ncbi:HEPN domain-containing protein [Cronobacter malonaticus]
MRKIRKTKPHIIEELKLLRETRKPFEGFTFTFLKNISEHCNLMHSLILKESDKKALFKIAYRQYFVSLVSCWETYFRDVFVYVHSRDNVLTNRLLEKMEVDASSYDSSDITLPELLSKSFNFQNLNDLEQAYNGLWGDDFLQKICTLDFAPCGFNGKIATKMIAENLIPNWRIILEKTFRTRHRVVHDANFRPEIDINLIQKAEAIFLLIPQLSSIMITKKLNLNYTLISKNDAKFPYIFSMHDILANDWHIIEAKPTI